MEVKGAKRKRAVITVMWGLKEAWQEILGRVDKNWFEAKRSRTNTRERLLTSVGASDREVRSINDAVGKIPRSRIEAVELITEICWHVSDSGRIVE